MEDGTLDRGSAPSVESTLFGDPTSFSFFQAVRLLERLHPDRTPVGQFADPSSETVRFSTHTSIAFPASEIQALEGSGSAAPRMLVNFLGVIGPQGVLPHWYTLLAAEQLRARQTAMLAFLDIFQHRIISHFYRAWAKPRAFVEHERAARDRPTLLLRSLLGLSRAPRPDQRAIGDNALLFYSGLLGAHRRSAVALEQLLGDYFGVRAEVLQFVGGWFSVPDESLCRLGEGDETTTLGSGSVVGDEVWDPQVRVRVRLGPLTREQHDSFLPTGSAYAELRDLTRLFAGDEVDFEVQLVLRREEVPPCVLDADDQALQLGWNTWIRTVPFTQDTDDATLTL